MVIDIILTWCNQGMLPRVLGNGCVDVGTQWLAYLGGVHQLHSLLEDSVHLPKSYHSQYFGDGVLNL